MERMEDGHERPSKTRTAGNIKFNPERGAETTDCFSSKAGVGSMLGLEKRCVTDE